MGSRSRRNRIGRVPKTQSIRMTITPPSTAAQKPAIRSTGELGLRIGGDDRLRLQADQQEHGVLQQELDRCPVHPLAEPGLPGSG